jgi:Flp pilus assembly pilin Flp
VKNTLKRLWREDAGQDLMEYGLLLVLIVLAAAALIAPLGTSIGTLFQNANTCANAPSAANCTAGGAGT